MLPRSSIQLLAIALLALPAGAHAFMLESPVTTGCHEGIALKALAKAGWPQAASAPAQTTADAALASNVEFTVPPDANAWTLSYLIGIRDNDLHGAAISDFPEFNAVQNGLDDQEEHCLRGPKDHGPTGDQTALAACRAYILGQVNDALGSADAPDFDATEAVKVALRYQTTDIAVNRYWFHMGKAIHALQDSYAHTFRTADLQHIQTVLNYVDPARDSDYDPAVDGPRHESGLDQCDDPRVAPAAEAATEASAELLSAVGSGSDWSSRLGAVASLLDDKLSYQPGCDASNDWCGHVPTAQGCSSTRGSPSLLVLLLAVAAITWGGRRPRRGRGELFVIEAAVTAALLVASSAAAEEVAIQIPTPSRVSLNASVGGALDRGGANVDVGAQFVVTPRLRLGAAIEYNPWVDVLSFHASPGAVNAYGTVQWSWANTGGIEISSALDAGASVLLFTAVGANAGSVGFFIGACLIRLGLKVSPRLTVELSPEFAVAVPSLGGVPLAYRQYRLSAGVRWDL